jgi:nucleotide-binding universal stress UspA family protein
MTASFASIMMPIEQKATVEVRAAGAVAALFGARLIGVRACPLLFAAAVTAGATPRDPLAEERAWIGKKTAEIERDFRKALEGTAVTVGWRSAVAAPLDCVIGEARAADLLVFCPRALGKPPVIDPGALTLRAGRPVLIIPEAAKWRTPERVLVGWKETREARRAVADALPFLLRAETVTIVEVVEDNGGLGKARKRVHDVADWLAGHGVKAQAAVRRPEGRSAESLEAVAKEVRADLVVAGAYGRTRLGEWIFGGVTRSLLTKSRRPVLFSH